MKILFTIGLTLALASASYAANDDDKVLHLHIQKGQCKETVDTRAFGDLKFMPPYDHSIKSSGTDTAILNA